MHLPPKLVAFWQRLTRTQRLSLISIVFFLVVLPVAIWLALSPTSPFSRAGGYPISSPISGPIVSPPPPPPSLAPTVEVTGPATGEGQQYIGPYTASARGLELASVQLYWKSQNEPSGHLIAEKACNKTSFCSTSGSFIPPTGGIYYVYTYAASHEGFGSCSGAPQNTTQNAGAELTGGAGGGTVPDCGEKSRITVSVTNPVITQTFNWLNGYNFVGLTVNKPNYKAADFLRDANSTFVTTPPRPFAKVQGGGDILSIVYRFNQTTYNWEYYASWGVGNNFVMRPGEGYVVRSTSAQEGASSIQGQGSNPESVQIGSRWSLVASPLGGINAEGVLQAMQGQNIDARVIARWNGASGRYQLHQIGIDTDNFQILGGEAYWVRNDGQAGTFNLP